MSSEDQFVYGVDSGGQLWKISLQDGARWKRKLKNPVTFQLKRCSSWGPFVWAVGSNGVIHLYVPKQDRSIEVTEEVYENQRWVPVKGFGNNLLPTDRTQFSNQDGTEPATKNLDLFSPAWEWVSDWQIDELLGNERLDKDGWTYAIDFPASYTSEKKWNSCVRRRRWIRTRKYVFTDKWNQLPPVQADHTRESFIDVGIAGLGISYPDVFCPWAVTVMGKVYFREGVRSDNPEGSKWTCIAIPEGCEACQVSVSAHGAPIVVSWTGGFLYRRGVTRHNMTGTDWIQVEGPASGLKQAVIGNKMLWGLTRLDTCCVLKGNLLEEKAKETSNCIGLGDGLEWVEIPDKMKVVSVSYTDKAVLALTELGKLMARLGISDEEPYGSEWIEISPEVFSDDLSSSSPISEQDKIKASSSDEDADSIRSSLIPEGHALECSASLDLLWIDCTCISALSCDQQDMEIGPWRKSILKELKDKKTQNVQFSFPEAMDPIKSSNALSKADAKIFLVSKKAEWLDGTIEITEDKILIFKSRIASPWICPSSNILSIMRISDSPNSLMFRIRAGNDSWVGEFVILKFKNEAFLDDWRLKICEMRNSDYTKKSSLSNIWLITRAGEMHTGCSILITAKECKTDVNSLSSVGEEALELPLPKGFRPGSEIDIAVKVANDAKCFTINLCGEDCTPFHFNPRFEQSKVIRNSSEHNDWGAEEADGVFPFVAGGSYSIHIICDENEFVAFVTSKHKFIYRFAHRMDPRHIRVLKVHGDVSVTSMKYDPVDDCENFQEFITQVYPGHFSKVATFSNGIVWALGHDKTVWSLMQSNSACGDQIGDVGAHNEVVTDEQIFFIYENQRWNPISGFNSHVLPTDRSPWSDVTGTITLKKEDFKLPTSCWSWVSDWEIDYDIKTGVDEEGWQYAVDFPTAYHKTKRFNDFVRRRRWKRICHFQTCGPWKKVPHLKLCDMISHINEDCDFEVLALTEDGKVAIRSNVNKENCIGEAWDVESDGPSPVLMSISTWFGMNVWGVGRDGYPYIRYKKAWQMVERPESTSVISVVVSAMGIWCIDSKRNLFRRLNVHEALPEGRDWQKVCGDVRQVSVSQENILYALLHSSSYFQCALARRVGVSTSAPNGVGWEMIAEGPWKQFCARNSVTRSTDR